MKTDNPLEALVAHYVSIAYHSLRKAFFSIAKDKGLSVSPEQFVVLTRLNMGDGLAQHELVAFMRRDAATVMRTIDALEKHALVRRAQDSKDRRANRVYITDQGHVFLKEARALFETHNQKLVDGLTSDDLAELIRILTRITTNAEAVQA